MTDYPEATVRFLEAARALGIADLAVSVFPEGTKTAAAAAAAIGCDVAAIVKSLVFMTGEYEDGIELNSTWATGDWSGNGEFDSADLVFAFQDGGYEQGPRRPVATAAAVNTVPEPSLPVLLLALVGGAMCLRRRAGRATVG